MQIWTNSRLKEYQTCPQKEFLRYHENIVPIHKNEALSLGSAVHKGLETRSIDEALELIPISENVSSQEEYDAQLIIRGICEAMLEGYFELYPEFENHSPEFMFEMKARYPTKKGMRSSRTRTISGKIDDIIYEDDGVWLVEYKTSGVLDKSYIDRLYIDSQVSFYMMALTRLGYKPKGIIYRVLRKPSIKQKKGETVDQYIERLKADYKERKDFYYYETKLYRSTEDLEEFEKMLWHEIKQEEKSVNEGNIFKHSVSCSQYGSCPYLPLCVGDSGAEMLFEKREPHEELKGE